MFEEIIEEYKENPAKKHFEFEVYGQPIRIFIG